jgi:hypothetical protein
MQITKLCLLTIVDRFNAKATGSMLGNGVITEVTNTIEEDAIGYYGVIVNGYYYMSPQLELYFVQNSLLVPVELQLLPDNIVEKYDLVALLDQLEVYLDSVIVLFDNSERSNTPQSSDRSRNYGLSVLGPADEQGLARPTRTQPYDCYQNGQFDSGIVKINFARICKKLCN